MFSSFVYSTSVHTQSLGVLLAVILSHIGLFGWTPFTGTRSDSRLIASVTS
jgi:hypothetical protein